MAQRQKSSEILYCTNRLKVLQYACSNAVIYFPSDCAHQKAPICLRPPFLPPGTYRVRQMPLSKTTGLFVLKFWGLQMSPQYDTRVFLTGMEAAGFSETSMSCYQATRCHILRKTPARIAGSLDSHLNTSRSNKQKCTAPPPPQWTTVDVMFYHSVAS
jgi:hypothetical protein